MIKASGSEEVHETASSAGNLEGTWKPSARMSHHSKVYLDGEMPDDSITSSAPTSTEPMTATKQTDFLATQIFVPTSSLSDPESHREPKEHLRQPPYHSGQYHYGDIPGSCVTDFEVFSLRHEDQPIDRINVDKSQSKQIENDETFAPEPQAPYHSGIYHFADIPGSEPFLPQADVSIDAIKIKKESQRGALAKEEDESRVESQVGFSKQKAAKKTQTQAARDQLKGTNLVEGYQPALLDSSEGALQVQESSSTADRTIVFDDPSLDGLQPSDPSAEQVEKAAFPSSKTKKDKKSKRAKTLSWADEPQNILIPDEMNADNVSKAPEEPSLPPATSTSLDAVNSATERAMFGPSPYVSPPETPRAPQDEFTKSYVVAEDGSLMSKDGPADQDREFRDATPLADRETENESAPLQSLRSEAVDAPDSQPLTFKQGKKKGGRKNKSSAWEEEETLDLVSDPVPGIPVIDDNLIESDHGDKTAEVDVDPAAEFQALGSKKTKKDRKNKKGKAADGQELDEMEALSRKNTSTDQAIDDVSGGTEIRAPEVSREDIVPTISRKGKKDKKSKRNQPSAWEEDDKATIETSAAPPQKIDNLRQADQDEHFPQESALPRDAGCSKEDQDEFEGFNVKKTKKERKAKRKSLGKDEEQGSTPGRSEEQVELLTANPAFEETQPASTEEPFKESSLSRKKSKRDKKSKTTFDDWEQDASKEESNDQILLAVAQDLVLPPGIPSSARDVFPQSNDDELGHVASEANNGMDAPLAADPGISDYSTFPHVHSGAEGQRLQDMALSQNIGGEPTWSFSQHTNPPREESTEQSVEALPEVLRRKKSKKGKNADVSRPNVVDEPAYAAVKLVNDSQSRGAEHEQDREASSLVSSLALQTAAAVGTALLPATGADRFRLLQPEQCELLMESAPGERKSILLEEHPSNHVNRDSGIQVSDSPVVAVLPYPRSDVRDSGYQGMEDSPLLAHDQVSTNRNSIQATPLDVSVEHDPTYFVQVLASKNQPVHVAEGPSVEDDQQLPTLHHRRSSSPNYLPQAQRAEWESPIVDSTSKARASSLFDSSPSTRDQPVRHVQLHQDQDPDASPSGIGEVEKPFILSRDGHTRELSLSDVDRANSKPRSLFGGPVGTNSDLDHLRSPPRTPLSTEPRLNTITETSPDDARMHHKHSRDIQDVGEPEHGVKAARQSQTLHHQLSHHRLHSPRGDNPRSLGLVSTDDIISRLSWPNVDEETDAVDLERNLSRNANETEHPSRQQRKPPPFASGKQEKQHEKRQENDLRSVSGQSARSNESISAIIKESGAHSPSTPPLRRVDRSLSSDLRAANKRDSLSDAKKTAKLYGVPDFVDPLAPPPKYDPVTNKGKHRIEAVSMADVYVR